MYTSLFETYVVELAMPECAVFFVLQEANGIVIRLPPFWDWPCGWCVRRFCTSCLLHILLNIRGWSPVYHLTYVRRMADLVSKCICAYDYTKLAVHHAKGRHYRILN